MVACVVHINYGRILLKWLIQEVEMGKRGSDYTTPESSSVAQIQLSTCSTISTCCSWLASCQGNSSRRRERHPHIQFNTGAYDSDETSPQPPTYYSPCPLTTVCCSLDDLWTVYCYSVTVVIEIIKELQIHFHLANFLCPWSCFIVRVHLKTYVDVFFYSYT